MKLELNKVCRSFDSRHALLDASASFEKLQSLVLIGPSGGGKSTLLRIIAGLETPDSGSVIVNEKRIAFDEASLVLHRRDIGVVFQSFNLFPHLSVEKNITLAPKVVKGVPPAEARALAEAVLRKVGLVEKIEAYPDQLSGGQQQRVAIARSLAMQPQLMLFDEITSALDPELVGEVLKVLEEVAREGMTMMLVTHEIGFARKVANRVVFMHEGKIWEAGPAAETLGSPRTPELETFLSAVLH